MAGKITTKKLTDRQKLVVMKRHHDPRSMWYLAGFLTLVLFWLIYKYSVAPAKVSTVWMILIFAVLAFIAEVMRNGFQRIKTISALEKKVSQMPVDPEKEEESEEEFKRQLKGEPVLLRVIGLSAVVYLVYGMFAYGGSLKSWPVSLPIIYAGIIGLSVFKKVFRK